MNSPQNLPFDEYFLNLHRIDFPGDYAAVYADLGLPESSFEAESFASNPCPQIAVTLGWCVRLASNKAPDALSDSFEMARQTIPSIEPYAMNDKLRMLTSPFADTFVYNALLRFSSRVTYRTAPKLSLGQLAPGFSDETSC